MVGYAVDGLDPRAPLWYSGWALGPRAWRGWGSVGRAVGRSSGRSREAPRSEGIRPGGGIQQVSGPGPTCGHIEQQT